MNGILSEYMWKPQTFMQDKIFLPHMNDRIDIKLEPGFQFIIYSKFVVQQSLNGENLLDIIFKRFDKCFPLKNTNVIILAK